jgi:hypothetical protein
LGEFNEKVSLAKKADEEEGQLRGHSSHNEDMIQIIL